jgi:hypothetical protein
MVVVLIFGSRSGVSMHDKMMDEKPVALMNGVAHLGNGDIIENAVITFEQGKITLVADARLVRLDLSGYEVMDIYGKHVYPIKACSKNKKRKYFDIITDTPTRQLTEGEPANLLVSAYEINCSGNSIVHVFVNGQAQAEDHFMIEENRLKVKYINYLSH